MLDNDSRLDPAVERRASKRFPIEQEVSYRVLDHKAIVPESGVGRTFDISSGGVLFATEQRLRFGKRIELSVNWPAVLEGRSCSNLWPSAASCAWRMPAHPSSSNSTSSAPGMPRMGPRALLISPFAPPYYILSCGIGVLACILLAQRPVRTLKPGMARPEGRFDIMKPMPDAINRRNFLKTTAAAAVLAGPAVISARGANDKLNIGWIGVGTRGNAGIGWLKKAAPETVQITAICDTYQGYLARARTS